MGFIRSVGLASRQVRVGTTAGAIERPHAKDKETDDPLLFPSYVTGQCEHVSMSAPL